MRELHGIGYDGHLTVEFVASVDRTPISDRADIGDASEAGGGVGDGEVPARPRAPAPCPRRYYDRYAAGLDRRTCARRSAASAARRSDARRSR